MVSVNPDVYTDRMLEPLARAAHEANRAYCEIIGDMSQPPWEQAPEWQRTSAMKGVEGALNGNTPEQSHESWLHEKQETGWVYGDVKDPEAKTHPCIMPYSQLPVAQRAKDHIFIGVVTLLAVSSKILE